MIAFTNNRIPTIIELFIKYISISIFWLQRNKYRRYDSDVAVVLKSQFIIICDSMAKLVKACDC